MRFQMKSSENKGSGIYKTLYIKEALVQKIAQIAKENDTSWNSVVIAMLEYCLSDEA